MLRLNLSTQPRWLDLGHGVRLLVEPLTTAIMLAAKGDPTIVAAAGDAEGSATNDDLARIVAKALREMDAGPSPYFPGGKLAFDETGTLHQMGGHSRGLQAVRVKTARGHVVIASDVAHHYRHLHERRVFPVFDSMSDVLEGYDRVLRLATSPGHVVPGHDPLVTAIYPAQETATQGWIMRLDRDPAPLDAN